MRLSQDISTRAVNALLSRLRQRIRRHSAFLAAAGRGAGPILRSGRVRLTGTVPSGQRFAADLQQVWRIADARATVDDVGLGEVGPFGAQPHLAGFWLPRRGVFAFADAFFEPYDAGRHTQVNTRSEVRTAITE